MSRIVSEPEFRQRLSEILLGRVGECGCVTGPGRSGAVAAVYASHMLGIPFIPYGAAAPARLGRLLLIDTAKESGATLRRASRRYAAANPLVLFAYCEPPRVRFWYEAPTPQRFRHESISEAA